MKIAVCVSGGGTNLQAIIDAIDNGTITNTQIEVVISNNADAYALERAKKAGIKAVCISPKNYESRAAFNEDFLKQLNSYHVDLVVLAGFLVVIPPEMIKQYREKTSDLYYSEDDENVITKYDYENAIFDAAQKRRVGYLKIEKILNILLNWYQIKK